ncbi:MAG: GNAT family N-acetyltransferase [Burkholderiales bacterium]|nr:GNAT family N-acetyltransferase [Burkholderiales bacterium]
MPELLTPRLRLRAFRAEDLDAYAAMCADAEVMRHIGEGQPVGRDIAWRQMAMFLGHWPLRGLGQWAVQAREDGRLLGRAGFLHPEGWPGCEAAWLLAREAWGQGMAFEAMQAALQWAHRTGAAPALISLIRPDNHRSARLAERLGARREGRIVFMGGDIEVFRHPPFDEG